MTLPDNLEIKELKTYVGNDKELKKNIIASCDMYCGKYYIHMKGTIKQYFKKTQNKDIFVIVQKNISTGINKLFDILGYCIISYKKNYDKYLVNINRNQKFIGYRYVNQKNARELLGDKFRYRGINLNIAHLNVICALTPDKIPILPKMEGISIKKCIKYFRDLMSYKKTRNFYQLEDRLNKIPCLGTYFLGEILNILKIKKMDLVKLSSLDLNCNDSRNSFYMRHGFNYSLNYYNHRIKFNQYTHMILDLNNISLQE